MALADALRGLRVYATDRVRLVIAVAVLALGVGLGLAINLVNAAALAEFSSGLVAMSGNADLTVRGSHSGIDERIFAALARMPEVAAASPVVEFDATDDPGRRPVTIIGIDALRAALVESRLVAPVPDDDRLALMRPDTLFAGPGLLRRLDVSVGDRLTLRGPSGTPFTTRIAGTLASADQHVAQAAVIDIAAAQLYGDRVGRVSRIDLRLRPGVSAQALERALPARLPPGLTVQTPSQAAASELRVSRAYRVNLTVLALVALFCGGLLIFSAQSLQIARRRQEFALLRALGVTRAQLVRRLLAEAALLGVPGAALGVALGYALALVALQRFGGDLGAGFFRGVTPELNISGLATAGYFLAGVATAVAGTLFPALEASRMSPARGLKPGSLEDAYRPITRAWPGTALIACGLIALFLPGIDDIPVGGYLAIALLLIGAVAVVPRVLVIALRATPSRDDPAIALGMAQLSGAPTAPGISLASIVAATSLTVAMMVMVHSFRISFQAWLAHILPAEAYLSGPGLRLTLEEQARIAAVPSVARVEFLRVDDVRLSSTRAPVALLARDIDPAHPETRLPLIASVALQAELPPVWVSESVAAVYELAAGRKLTLPLSGRSVEFYVAGIFRDYGRQQGAVVIQRAVYRAVTGDGSVTNAAFWLRRGHGAGELRQALAWLGPSPELKETAEIRSVSLSIFDRTFAITYALVAVAVVIGLAALGANTAALILARRREFAVLRHLGFRRRDIMRMLLAQTSMIVVTALVMGCMIGLVVGAVLIYVVNRQSFHWTMELHVPLREMGVLAFALMLLALLVTAAGARAALTRAVVRSAAEDW